MKEIVAINGEIFDPQNAKISVFDRGFLYGDGIYEVTRSYSGVLYALEDHIDRLFNSGRMIGLEIGIDKRALQNELYRIYKIADPAQDNLYMRVIITRGEGKISLDTSSATKPNTVVIVRHLEKIDPSLYTSGMNIIAAKTQRNPKKSLDPNIKSGNYLNNVLALAEAKKAGAHDAMMVNRDGFVTEGTTWNIFIVKDQALITPPDDADILQGITRKTLRAICKSNDIKWLERQFTIEEAKKADECFATGTIKEVMAIRSIDGVAVGSGSPGPPGPMTLKIAQLYKKHVADYCKTARG